jgi:multimeric flavodoxin WrbA
METVEINILGISGTDIKDGNCDTLVKESLKGADEIGEEVGGVETDFVTLADKEIVRCKHCQWCIENRAPCKIQDDFYLVYEKLKKCDGFILGAPSWFRTCGPRLMEFWSRLRFSVFFSNELRNKVGGAVSLGFFGYGVEHTLDVLQGFAAIGEIFVARESAMASTAAFGQRPAYLEHGVLDDIQGIHRVRMVGKKVAEVARMIRYATDNGIVLPDDYRMRTRFGAKVRTTEEARKNMELVDGVWRKKKS